MKHSAARVARANALTRTVPLLRSVRGVKRSAETSCVSLCVTSIGCIMVTSDQPQPLDLSIQTPQAPVKTPPPASSPWHQKIGLRRSGSISDGDSGDSGDHDGSRSPSETLSVSLSVTPTPSDASVTSDTSGDVSPRYPVTKRFLHKYQAEQTIKKPDHVNTPGASPASQESLVNNKDLLSYGECL